ncbi:hypothetical protein [Paenibacillus antri]|uniref:hypothetical protein n=1 Tax=Paenibacillus antri TaxID=2582848 RepID=UPI0013052434|nr:hypothetical protein [Paenibacillus antri]
MIAHEQAHRFGGVSQVPEVVGGLKRLIFILKTDFRATSYQLRRNDLTRFYEEPDQGEE